MANYQDKKMYIAPEEYQKRRQIFDLFDWINEILFKLDQEPNFEELYFERKEPILKKLLEEAIPVSYLGLYFSRPWKKVSVQCLIDNPDYDAIIEIQEPHQIQSKQLKSKQLKIEVTTTEDDFSTMRRQALSRIGFVHFTGTVKRKGREIVTEGEFVEVEEEAEKIINLALERLQKKLENIYDEETVILVYITTYMKLANHHRYNLVEQAKYLLRKTTPMLYGVFFCYSSNLGVDGIISNSQRYDSSP